MIEAALGLVSRDGLGSVTMMKIAETAGVARQTLYNHYPDVDSIVVEAIGRHNRESIELLDASLRVVATPEDQLEQLVRHMVSIGAHAHHASGIEHGLSAGARATLGEHDAELDRRIRGILEEGTRSGAFRRDLDPDIDAVLIRHILNGLAHRAASTPEQAAQLAATGTRTVLAAVGQS
ncbi:MAG: TetR/AcrR family transcriptional regulator [Acidimicrobiia bacterium]